MPGEPDAKFAQRVLGISRDRYPSLTDANWGGRPTLFVAYDVGANDREELRIVALMQEPNDDYRKIDVTTGEDEGGAPELSAIGFAKATVHDPQSLIVLLKWPVIHATAKGDIYEVRIFGFPAREQTKLSPLKISKHFGSGCECWHDDGPPGSKPYTTHYRYKTIAAVKAELRRLGD